MAIISQESAYIFRITHIDNVPWLLANGLQCRNSQMLDPNFREIGCKELIDKRSHRVVPIPPGGTLSDYVPFYFTHYSPMLLNIKTGHNGTLQTPMEQIVILVSSLHKVIEQQKLFIYTDRHAYLETAQFKSSITELGVIDWKILQNRDFKRNPDDPGKFERYQAEALIHRTVPVSTLLGMVCYNTQAQTLVNGHLADANLSLKTIAQPTWYF